MKFPLPLTTFPVINFSEEDKCTIERVAVVVVKQTVAQYPRQRHTAYVEDGFVDWRVIAPIIKPTPESPFRELSIKWTVKGIPPLLGTVLRNRDTLYIESIGYAQTPNGERIGYHLQHSVEVPGIHELTEYKIVRARISFCHLFRQLSNNTVEVFVQGRIEPMGDAFASVAATISAEVPVSVSKNVHRGEMKKLTRILRSKRTTNTTSNSSSWSSPSRSSSSASQPSTAAPASASTCSMCSKSVGGRVASLTSSGKEKHCRICRQRVCSRCRVYKDIFLRTELEKDVSCTTMAFCTRCIVMASKASSVQFAEYDARVYAGKPVDEFEFDLGI
uniref:FYVE-type domain-containing protein n=1 Tax=Globisporangium ultimum (strain ATCC 200006 / CBS 805.95 / DAOM BR144) TaxID=431595 RepID=K3W6C9_GLOUD